MKHPRTTGTAGPGKSAAKNNTPGFRSLLHRHVQMTCVSQTLAKYSILCVQLSSGGTSLAQLHNRVGLRTPISCSTFETSTDNRHHRPGQTCCKIQYSVIPLVISSPRAADLRVTNNCKIQHSVRLAAAGGASMAPRHPGPSRMLHLTIFRASARCLIAPCSKYPWLCGITGPGKNSLT